jgi:hypothetical protein
MQEEASTSTQRHRLATQEPTDMAAGRHLRVTDVTIDTGLQAVFLRAGETHTRASHKRAGRRDTALVASKSPPYQRR